MTGLLLILTLVGGGVRTWSWDEVPTATSYTLYAGSVGAAWSSVATADATDCTAGTCATLLDMDTLPVGLVLLLVTASNANGESVTEHGACAGECVL